MISVICFSVKPEEQVAFQTLNLSGEFALTFHTDSLSEKTMACVEPGSVICCLVADTLDKTVLTELAKRQVSLIALRSAGFDHVDLETAKQLNITVTRIPSYSPEAIAEHAVTLLLCLIRKIHQVHQRVQQYNYSLDGLLGYNLHDKTIGIIGMGHIGYAFAKIIHGFGCKIIAHDIIPHDNPDTLPIKWVTLQELYQQADCIALHCPLNSATHHLIDAQAIDQMKPGMVLINTSRGAVLDTDAILAGLASKQIGALGIDVYEYEKNIFFHDLSQSTMTDTRLQKLQSFENVLITPHQAFFTQEALENRAQITLDIIKCYYEHHLDSKFILT